MLIKGYGVMINKVITNYKYNPDNYKGVCHLSKELADFYELHEQYILDKSESKWFALRKHSQDMFFTMKHAVLQGTMTRADANEMYEYMEELLDD